jgi:hypothetical protein
MLCSAMAKAEHPESDALLKRANDPLDEAAKLQAESARWRQIVKDSIDRMHEAGAVLRPREYDIHYPPAVAENQRPAEVRDEAQEPPTAEGPEIRD